MCLRCYAISKLVLNKPILAYKDAIGTSTKNTAALSSFLNTLEECPKPFKWIYNFYKNTRPQPRVYRLTWITFKNCEYISMIDVYY